LWDVGDGGVIIPGPTPIHKYPDNGTYTATLTVTDPYSLSDTDTATVTIDNLPPTVTCGPDLTIYSGQNVPVNAQFRDPGIKDAPWTWEIDWDEGTNDMGSVLDQSTIILGSHQYLIPGEYIVTVTVTDKDGDSGSCGFTVIVLSMPVDIDIKLGSDPNSLNLNGNGVVPVGVFGSTDLDIINIDVSTVLFGITGNNATPVHNGHLEDLNGDGIYDIVFHFREGELGIDVNTEGETIMELYLTALLNNGSYIKGTDVVRITPNNIDSSRGKGGKGPK